MKIEIQLTTFVSHGDERRFFHALEELDCIANIKGVGRGLTFDLDIDSLTKAKLMDLIAVLYRYGIDLSFLNEIADIDKKYLWILDKNFYWHK